MPEQERVEGDVTAAAVGFAGEQPEPTLPEPTLPEPTLPEPTLPEPTLPEPVRQRVIALAAAAMTGMPPDEVPPSLRKVAQFAPNRRAKLGGTAIAAQLAADLLFRQRAGARVIEAAGELGAAVRDGSAPGAADPVEVAALAYLARPDGWRRVITETADSLKVDAGTVAVAERLHAAEHRAIRADHERAVAKVEAEKLRDELVRLRAESDVLRDQVRELTRTVREAHARERKVSEQLATERGRATKAAADAEAELRRVRAKLLDAELTASGARSAAKEARAVDDARLWLLLETIGQAAHGLKRELAIEPATKLPADQVADAAAERPGASGARNPARALDADDPARLDQLLALPRAHLIVDGYNVTKRGFGDLSLEQQRARLISALAGIAAQSGAETTVVFDGAEKLNAVPGIPRGLRVLFSRKGQTADDLIRQLVRAEPPGRPLVVVSSDREVADGVRRHGAYPLSSDTLLRRIARS
jgi:predicted RNA-binding protein with PIN domain